jgi:Flp pilus assembly protein TadG
LATIVRGLYPISAEDDIMTTPVLRKFARDREANVAIVFALSLIPITLLTGMAMDFTSAEQKKAELDTAADAAAIAAVTPAMMAKTDAQAITAAQNLFNSKATNITGLTYSPSNLTVTVTDSGLNRTATVSYTASSQNGLPGWYDQVLDTLPFLSKVKVGVAVTAVENEEAVCTSIIRLPQVNSA